MRTPRLYPVDQWIAAYKAGQSGERIARAHGGVTSVTVLERLREAGVDMRPAHTYTGNGRVVDYVQAQAMLDAGATTSAVARAFGVTPTAIRLAIHRGHLRRRDTRAVATIRQRAEFLRVVRCRGCGSEVVGIERCEVCK